jgi:hypothetical protein
MSDIIKADLCVIGAGSGGLTVAAGGSQMGAKVVLIEKGEMGGDCLNYGCVPSKALLAAGHAAQNMRDAGRFGITAVEPEIDFAAVKRHVKGVVEGIAPMDSQARFEGMGVQVIRAAGRFTGPREVEAGGMRIQARRFVVATGSSAAIPPIPGIADVPVLTNETIFDLEVKPDHLIVIGGGPIGAEMAQAHRQLGCRVTVLEMFALLGRDEGAPAVGLPGDRAGNVRPAGPRRPGGRRCGAPPNAGRGHRYSRRHCHRTGERRRRRHYGHHREGWRDRGYPGLAPACRRGPQGECRGAGAGKSRHRI